MNLFVRNTLRFIFLCASATSSVSYATPLGDYFSSLKIDNGTAPFTDIAFYSTLASKNIGHKIDLYLIPGDVLHFVKTTASTPAKNAAPVIDGMIISTNIELDFDADNPGIQRQLRTYFSQLLQDKIKLAFKKSGGLTDYAESIVVDLGIDSSPRFMCFVATDKKSGDAYADQEWIDSELSQKRISKRIAGCLKKFEHTKVRTIVTPMIGTSKVDLQSGFIENDEKRIKMHDHLIKSTSGIIDAIKEHIKNKKVTSFREIMLVLWAKDLERLIPNDQLKDGSFRRSEIPGGYVDLRRAFQHAIDAPLALPPAPIR